MIITISGKPGSGKSTIGRLIAKKLKYKFISVGDLRGQLAQKHGMNIDEFNELGKKEKWTDVETDKLTKELAKKDKLVVDARLGWHFIPKSVKVFLDCDLRVAAERIFRDQRPDEPLQDSVEDVMKMLKLRVENTRRRYRKWYNVDFLDKAHYDILIDTTNMNADELVSTILSLLRPKI